MQVLGYVLGGIFLCGCIAVLVINVVGLVRDIKDKKSKKGDTN